ncbi:MAG: response regulator [Lentisphaeraceae bacterium]|nr:response regulator [Lentisphaeraceae bacterium]
MVLLEMTKGYELPSWAFVLIVIQTAIIFVLAYIALSHKQTQEELSKSRRMLNDVINAIPVRVFWKDKNSIYMGCNQLFADDTGRGDPDKVVGDIDNNFAFYDQADDYRKDDREVMQSGESKIHFEEQQTRPDGVVCWLNTSKIPLRNKNGEIYGVLGTYEDITNRKKVEEELKLNEQQLRSINANIPGVLFQFIATQSGEWKMRYVSQRSKDIFGIDNNPESFVENFIESLHPDDKQSFIDSISYVVEHEIPWTFNGRLIRDDGETIYFNASSSPSQHEEGLIFHGLILDETEQHKMEEKLHHGQKMEAVGQLAGGIAHDFNNMLGGIVMAAELLGNHIDGTEKSKRFQEIIFDSAGHASVLTQQLLAFSRKQPSSSKNLELHKVLNDVVSILKNTVDKRIKIITDLSADFCTVFGDSSHLQSAFLNLGINASHALPDGGEISIISRNKDLGEADCKGSSFELKAGPYLEIEVKDNGCGIEAKHLGKIFDPFFTTKEQGKGTGLGLAAVYGTVQQHKGSISVKSTPGEETSFIINLPLSKEAGSALKEAPKEYKGKGRILVIDDELVMRETVQAILETLGYEAVTAENGRVGFELFKANPSSFDLVLMDMIMPEMNGKDCFTEMRKERSDIKVILTSGYSDEKDLTEMQAMGLNGFLKKPYNRASLSETIADVLVRAY